MKDKNVIVYRLISDTLPQVPLQPFNKNNVFIFPIELFDLLIIAIENLIDCLVNLPDYDDNELCNKLSDIIKYSKINKDIQLSLIHFINKKGFNLTNVKFISERELFYYRDNISYKDSPERFNIKFNNELGLMLGRFYPNVNPNTLRDFYILNDFNYLNNSLRYNIGLNIIISLTEAKIGLIEFNKS